MDNDEQIPPGDDQIAPPPPPHFCVSKSADRALTEQSIHETANGAWEEWDAIPDDDPVKDWYTVYKVQPSYAMKSLRPLPTPPSSGVWRSTGRVRSPFTRSTATSKTPLRNTTG